MFGEPYHSFQQNFDINLPGDPYNYYYLYFRFKDATDAYNYYRKYYEYHDVKRHLDAYQNLETYIQERDKANIRIKEFETTINALLTELVFYKAINHHKKCNILLINLKEAKNQQKQIINNTTSAYIALYNSITIDIKYDIT